MTEEQKKQQQENWDNLQLPSEFMSYDPVEHEQVPVKGLMAIRIFIQSLTSYLNELGYETVTTSEVRKCLHEIFYQGKVESADLVHMLIAKHIDESSYGGYQPYNQ